MYEHKQKNYPCANVLYFVQDKIFIFVNQLTGRNYFADNKETKNTQTTSMKFTCQKSLMM